MWWTISTANAYALFKDEKYLDLADESFCRVWYGSYSLKDRGSYDSVNGGMFWKWNNSDPGDKSDHAKMACINFPTVVAAMNLYNGISPSDTKHQKDDNVGFDGNGNYPRWHSRDTYLKNAKDIYAWAVDNLFDKSTGNVADSRTDNSVDWTATIYNQATFIGASCLLYKATGDKSYLTNAVTAATYSTKTMSAPYDILPFKDGEEQGIYTAIFAQYMTGFCALDDNGNRKEWFSGYIKKIRIWKTNRTEDQIRQSYLGVNSDATADNPDLVAAWDSIPFVRAATNMQWERHSSITSNYT